MTMKQMARPAALGLLPIWLALCAPAAAAPTQIGQTATPTASESDPVVQVSTEPIAPSYAVPAPGGVITSWSYQGGASGGSLKLVVFRQTAVTQFLVVGASSPQAVTAGTLSTFATRVPVQADDLLGLQPSGSLPIAYVATGASNVLHLLTPVDPPVGSTASTGLMANNRLLDIAATVESDADGDGFGDDTQDNCPTDASAQGPCPDKAAPTVTLAGPGRQDILKRKAVLFTARTNEAATLAATGSISVPGASRTFKLKPVSATVDSQVTRTFKLKLRKKALAAAKRALGRGRRVGATVSVTARDAAGNASAAAKRSIKIKSKKRKRR